MRHTLIAVTVAALTLPFASAAMAGPMEKACLNSDRRGATRAVCSCIQQVADMTLKGGDQRKAARFFADPDRAQDVRMSSKSADDAFWDRYRNFGSTAEAYCAG